MQSYMWGRPRRKNHALSDHISLKINRRRAGESTVGGCRSSLAVYHLARHLRDGGDPATLGGLGPMVGTAGATVWPNPLKILLNQIERQAPRLIQKTGIFKRRAILIADAGLAVVTGDRGATPDGRRDGGCNGGLGPFAKGRAVYRAWLATTYNAQSPQNALHFPPCIPDTFRKVSGIPFGHPEGHYACRASCLAEE